MNCGGTSITSSKLGFGSYLQTTLHVESHKYTNRMLMIQLGHAILNRPTAGPLCLGGF